MLKAMRSSEVARALPVAGQGLVAGLVKAT